MGWESKAAGGREDEPGDSKMDKEEDLEENVWEVVPVKGSKSGPKMFSHEAVVHGNSMFLFGNGQILVLILLLLLGPN